MPPLATEISHGKFLFIVIGEHAERQPDLLLVVHALDALGAGLGAGQGGQQQARENGDDGDDNQQLDESEAAVKFLGLGFHWC